MLSITRAFHNYRLPVAGSGLVARAAKEKYCFDKINKIILKYFLTLIGRNQTLCCNIQSLMQFPYHIQAQLALTT